MSAIRQNFNEETEASINKQINMELYASYVYMGLASYFGQSDVGLPGFQKFFKASSEEERTHAEKLIKYQSLRGGMCVFKDIKAPEPLPDKFSGKDALAKVLELERKVNDALLELHGIAGKHNDAHLCDFLESEFLNEQVDSINQLGHLITQANRCGEGLGEFEFDKVMGSAAP